MSRQRHFPRKPRHAFDVLAQREIHSAVMSLLKIQVISGDVDTPQIVYSKSNVVIVIPKTSSTTGSAVKMYKISTIPPKSSAYPDYFMAKEWDGTTLGSTEINIAKTPKQRPSLTGEAIDGVSLTYTYSSDNQRLAKDINNNSQVEYCYPRYKVGDVIFAAESANDTGVLVSGAKVEWIDLTARVWVRANPQP